MAPVLAAHIGAPVTISVRFTGSLLPPMLTGSARYRRELRNIGGDTDIPERIPGVAAAP
jgi:hypothetical protein